MPETRVIPTITTIAVSGSDVDITAAYLDLTTLPDTLSADIAEQVGIQDGTPYIEGELIIKMKNSPQNIDYVIDNNGNLILVINTGDASKYEVDQLGHLTYTS